MVIALVGNANCGKTTLFNQLTGSNQHVGNFPGVTVEQKYGDIAGYEGFRLVDLPGIYSLRPYSGEELVTRSFILDSEPDAVINIADATNIQRSLYLTLQLIELGRPTVLALNMMDELLGNRGYVDTEKLSKLLGIPVVAISAARNDGVEQLMEITADTAATGRRPLKSDFLTGAVERCIQVVCRAVKDPVEKMGVPPRFAAVRLMEQDEEIPQRLGLNEKELELVERAVLKMEAESGLDRHTALAQERYRFIESLYHDAVKFPQESREQRRSEKIDRLLTNKYLAIPIFTGIMAVIFLMTFSVLGQRLSDMFSWGIADLAALAESSLTTCGINPVVKSLVIDGVFAGVGSVLSFLPVIVVLFFFLSVLEDTGYMARVAFIMD